MISHDAVWEHRWADKEIGVRSVIYHAPYCFSDFKHIKIPENLLLLSEASI